MIRQFAAVLFATALVAQEAVDPNRFVPANALLTVRIKAPALWRDAFAKTAIATILRSAAVAPKLAPLGELFDKGLDAQDGIGMPREVVERLWNEYRGELVISVCAGAFGNAADEDGEVPPPPFAAMVALTPDGSYPLDQLLAGFRAMDEKSDAPLVEMQFGDHRFRRTDLGGEPADITQFEFVDQHLVLFVGNAIEQFAPAMLATTDRAAGPGSSAPLSIHVDTAPLLAMITERAQQGMDDVEAEVPFDAEDLLGVTGFSSVRSMDFRVTTLANHLACEVELGTRGDLGLLGILLGTGKASSLLRLVPPRSESFSVSQFDINALWRTMEKLFGLAADEQGQTLADIEAEFARATGVRLREDLLDHLGTGVMTLGDARGLFEVVAEQQKRRTTPDPNRVFADYCWGIELRNGKALAQSIDKMLRAGNLLQARKTEEYRGHEIHKLRIAAVIEVEYAITDGVLLCVLGTRGDGVTHLRGVLDAIVDGNSSSPEALAKWLPVVPEGWSGIQVMPFLDIFATIAATGGSVRRNNQSPNSAYSTGYAFGQAMLEALKDLAATESGEAAIATYATPQSLRWLFVW